MDAIRIENISKEFNGFKAVDLDFRGRMYGLK